MSADTEVDRSPDSESVLETFQQWYHVPLLFGALAYMLWIRTRAYDRFVTEDQVFFRGNDAYYHFRSTMYSVENWPRSLYGDAYTYFPYGQNVGHFGTLFDQFWATVALIVGLGDPTARQVGIVAVLAPAIIGTAVAIPTYFLGKRLSGRRIGGVTAAALLALLPQASWISRSTVGFYDHHVAETLMMTITVLAMVHAVSVVQRERPVYEQVADRDWDGLRPSLVASGLAGVALGLFVLVWPPSIVLAGILGVFFVVAICVEVLRGDSPEHLAFAGVVSMLVATAFVVPAVRSLETGTVTVSLLHALFVPSIALGCVVLAALARYWDREQIDPTGYPAAVGAFGIVTIGIAVLVVPDVIDAVWTNLQRILFLGQTDTTKTIGEAQSMNLDALGTQFFRGYGFAVFTGFIAMLLLAWRGVFARRGRAEYLLVAVWSLFLVLMAITQLRFHYYLVVAVAVLNGWLVVQALELVDYPPITAPERLETYHVLTVIVVLMLLFVPVLIGGVAANAGTPTAAAQASEQQPGSVQAWQGSLDWMAEETPEPGQYGGADNEVPYYGPYGAIDDYEYPEGAYGVMSWWDYGHWITVEGERIPTANPFQSGPRSASAFFQATDEERANKYLESLSVRQGGGVEDLSDEELDQLLESRTEQQAQEEVRYVTIDDQMVGGKFAPITEWAGPEYGDYFENRQYRVGQENTTLPVSNQRHRNTMISRLYTQDAATLSHYRLVDESDRFAIVGGYVDNRGARAARSLPLRGDGGWNTGGDTSPRNVSRSLQRANFGGAAVPIGQNSNAYVYDAQVESRVKTYERVPGATITGEAEANQTVRATVELETDAGRTFNYVQTATAAEDGSFEMTVPYATTNELGPDDGYTNSSVVATEEYTVEAGSGGSPFGFNAEERATGVAVPEPAIYDGDTIDVTLEPTSDGEGGANESTADGSGG